MEFFNFGSAQAIILNFLPDLTIKSLNIISLVGAVPLQGMHPLSLQLWGGEVENYRKVFAGRGSEIFICVCVCVCVGGGGGGGGVCNFEVKFKTA